jgi:hypothetical protein
MEHLRCVVEEQRVEAYPTAFGRGWGVQAGEIDGFFHRRPTII